MMKWRNVQCAVILALGTTGCTNRLEAFTHGDQTRHYSLYKPEGLPDNAPLVFMLHGYQGLARLYQSSMGFDDVADEHGFAIVYPQGTYDDNFIPHWNAGLEISEVNDIGFLTELAKQLQIDHNFDPERTFTSGISNGGFMSYTLACESSDVFKGMASIIGTMSGHTWNNCTPENPMPVLQISGLIDTVVPMDGTMSTEGNLLTIIIKTAKVIGIVNAAKFPDNSPGDNEFPTISKTPVIARKIENNVIKFIFSLRKKYPNIARNKI